MAEFKDTYKVETDSDTSGLDNARSGIDGFAGAALGAVSAIGGLAIISTVTGFITDSVTAGYEFEQQLNRIAGATGATGDELEEMKDIARDVWEQGFGTAPEEVINALTQVATITGATGDELQALTEDALALSATFGTDVNESTRAANQLMQQFGISGEEAFDIIAGMMQASGDPAGDLLDTLQEYGSIFAEMGLSADEVATRLMNASEAGVFGFDKSADAMREFTIRFKEGTDEQAAAWDTLIAKTDEFDNIVIGGKHVKNFEDLQTAVADGSITIAEAGDMMHDALMQIEDPAERAALATTLVGTQFEDLGEDILATFDATPIDEFAGSMDGVKKSTLAGVSPLERFKRSMQGMIAQAAIPLINAILDELNPALESFTAWLKGDGLASIEDFASGILDTLQPAFDAILPIIGDVIQFVSDLSQQFTAFIAENPQVVSFFVRLAATAAAVVTGFIAVSSAVSGASAILTGIGAVIALLTSPIFLLIAAVVALVTAYQTNFLGFRDIIDGAIAGIIPIIEGLIGSLKRIWDDVQPKLAELLAWFTTTGIPAIRDAINTLVNDVITPFINTLVNIWTTVQPGLQAFWDWFVTTGLPFIKLAIQLYMDNYLIPLIDMVAGFYSSVAQGLIDFAQWFLATGLPFIRLAIQTLMDNYITPLIDLVSGIYAAVSVGLNLFKSWFTESGIPAINTAIDGVITIFNSLRDRVNTFWDSISTAINAMKNNFTGIFEAMLSPIQAVIDLVDDLISAIADIDLPDVPDWVPGQGLIGNKGLTGARPVAGVQGFGGGASSNQAIVIESNLIVDGQVLARAVKQVEAQSAPGGTRPVPLRVQQGVY